MKPQLIDWKYEATQKDGYDHFLLKEINEQKITIPKTGLINSLELKKLAEKIGKAKKVFLVGCGSAYYCALAGKYFFAQAGIEVAAHGAYEFEPFNSFYEKDSVGIFISQSGETADTLIAAKANGVLVAALVNARGSTLERLADVVIPVGAGPEIAVVSTKAFTAQLATLYLLAQGEPKKVRKLGEVLEKWFDKPFQNKILEIAKGYGGVEDMYIIGKHFGYPAGLEFALKIKETSYIHAEAFASGELKHGVITLIQKDTPCIVLVGSEETRDEVLSSAAQLKARGAKVIGVSTKNSMEFDEFIKIPDMGNLTIFPMIMVGQLLGYYLGMIRGADPDKPRNLAKSVTVK